MSITTLIIDDEIQYGELLIEIAELNDIEAIFIHDSNELEKTIRKYPTIKLIFLDLNMPKRDGIEVLRALDLCQFKGYVLLMSGFDDPVLNTAFELAKNYSLQLLEPLKKPFDIHNISALMKSTHNPTTQLSAPTKIPKPYTMLTAEDTIRALNDGRITLFFQPQISMFGQAIVGAEALVRLIDENGDIITPERFIPVIEKHHITQVLLSKIVEELCVNAPAILRKFGGLTLSINLSTLDLNRLTLPEEITEKLIQANIDTSQICIEVTESQQMQYDVVTLDILTRLRLKGFQLAIDDFGTGASVIDHLRKVPFTELKIDRSFVKKILTCQRSQHLLTDMINMAHNQNMHVVVEGVEDQETYELVRAMDADIVQGYYFARPMPVEELLVWNMAESVT